MNSENEGTKKDTRERKGAHLNEAFRAHGGSVSCGCFPNPEGKLQPGSHFYPELVELIINSTDRTSRDYLNRQRSFARSSSANTGALGDLNTRNRADSRVF